MLFRFELKSNIKKVIIYMLITMCLVYLSLRQVDSSNYNLEILEALPRLLRGLLGVSGYDKNTFMGSYFFIQSYLVLIFMLYFINMGFKITAVTSRYKSDFLYTTISKDTILIKKLLVCITLISILVVFNMFISFLLFFSKEENISYIFTSSLMVFVTLLLITSLGMFIGAVSSNHKLGGIICSIFVFGVYLLHTFSLAFEVNFLSYFSLFYYSFKDVINVFYIIFCILSFGLLMFFTQRKFKNTDI